MTNYSVYVVSADHYDYDEYDAIAVIASNKDEAYRLGLDFFALGQGPFKISRICGCDATDSGILLASFNAG